MDKKEIRPSVSKVKVFCEGCGESDNISMINQEINEDTQIKQFCKKCDRITIWKIKGVYL